MNEAMALMNCPKVSVEARLSPLIMLEMSGLSDVCMSALPMPSSEKAVSMMGKFSPKSGSSSDTTVTSSESSTVFLRPMRFMSMPVGTEKMRNQKKTSDGKMLAVLSSRARSAFT